jgi:cardiolipin synthase
VDLLVLPEDGLSAVVTAIERAKSTVDTTIFRFDRPEVEKALSAAVGRGVHVRALVAHTNRGGEKLLRKLEQRLLGEGVTLARTGDDFGRYHGKMLIIDGRKLYVMLFNFTALDARSRSFGVVTEQRTMVAEARQLFEADATRQPYAGDTPGLVVSPENARKQLAKFISKAKRELWIYDPKVSDGAMLRLLEERVQKGVDVRVIGSVGARANGLKAEKLKGLRLHARVIICDGRKAFLGSQSLRTAELDSRRELGIIVKDARIVKQLRTVFEKDWSRTPMAREEDEGDLKEVAEAATT